MKKFTVLISFVFILGYSLSSCETELYDKEIVEQILDYSFHNDTVDAYHTWRLMSEHNIHVENTVSNSDRVLLLTEDPHENETAEILSEQPISDGGSASMLYSVALAQHQLYAAVVTVDGAYHVTPFKKGDSKVTVLTDSKEAKRTYKPSQQEVYYCFCTDYPQPSSSWDFNDLVLRISRKDVDDYTVQLNVTLVAVGTMLQEAAALRLAGVDYDEIESLTRVNNKSFAVNSSFGRTIIKDGEDLLHSLNGEAVINLFDDAHIALNSDGIDASAQVIRGYYNVGNSTDPSYLYANEVTVSYLVKFKQKGRAKAVTYDIIDPFVAYNYNGSIWEVHKYLYKHDEVLFHYYSGNPFNYDTGYTWALEIPYSWFRYPLQGYTIGSYKEGVIRGCYRERGHSFGEWAANRNQAIDWYLYPMQGSVY